MDMELGKRICCVAPHFYPGYKAGGTLRSLHNFCEVFKGEYDIDVITSASDLGNTENYSGIILNRFYDRGGYRVFYGGSLYEKLRRIYQLCAGEPNRIIYINSFFDPRNSIAVMLMIKIFVLKNPIVLAPRGELSEQALSLKKIKKEIYLMIFRFLFSGENIVFQASSVHEKMDIERVLKRKVLVKIATDVPLVLSKNKREKREVKERRSFKIISVARISRIKNFEFMFEALKNIGDVAVEYNIYGDIDDSQYLDELIMRSKSLPVNIAFSYCGSVKHEELHSVFLEHQLSVLPSLSENFGHVVFESLSSGVPVICSYETPWRDYNNEFLRCCELDVSLWAERILEFSRFSDETLEDLSQKSLSFARTFSQSSGIKNMYEELFGG